MNFHMNTLADFSLNGWEISGIVVGLLVVVAAWFMLPEFIRYMKIRHM